MDWRENPEDEKSKFASFTRSLMDSKTFLRRDPCTSLSSNIFPSWCNLGLGFVLRERRRERGKMRGNLKGSGGFLN
jgi:hypothetical protein